MDDATLDAARELLAAIDARWEGESDKKRSHGVSNRMERAIKELKTLIHYEPPVSAAAALAAQISDLESRLRGAP